MRLPDASGKLVVVTGATSGIGRETALALATAGATTVVASRNPSNVAATVDELRRRSGSDDVHGLDLDLASVESIRGAAQRVLDQWDRLDVLVNNAGVYLSNRSVTADGFEMTFGINHLGHFLLTKLLLDRLRENAPSRVVTVSSVGHRFAKDMGFDDLHSERNYSIHTAYCRSKLANVLFTKELARREAATGVSAFAVHPGNVRSGFGQDGDTTGVMGAGLGVVRLFMAGPRRGAAATLYAATAPGLESRSGGYFQRRAGLGARSVHEARPSAAARDESAARQLWDVSEQLVASAEGQR